MEQSEFKAVINTIVAQPEIHAKWLNSLSMMENTGARKISRYQHPVHTDLVVLKHAAEEARHAYYLKKLITRIVPEGYPDYSFAYLLAPVESYRYLHRLDTETSRYLQGKGLKGRD